MATQGRKKQARNVTEAVTKGVKQMDTEDTLGLLVGVVCSAVFYQFAEVTVAGMALNTAVGSYSLFGSAVTYAMIGAVGGGLFQLATNQLRGSSDGFNLDTLETWGLVLSMLPTVLVFWNSSFASYVHGDFVVGGILTAFAGAGYVLLAAAPRMKYRSN
jgi:hypothetical protein